MTSGFTLGAGRSVGLGRCIRTGIQYYSIIQSMLTILKILCALPIFIPPPACPATTDLFIVCIALSVPECLAVGII